MITDSDLLTLLPGRKVMVSACEAREHGDNAGCLCALKGKIMVMAQPYESIFAGTVSWHLEGSDKRARLSEVTLVVEN